MSVMVYHKTQCTIPDNPNAAISRDEWNEGHEIVDASIPVAKLSDHTKPVHDALAINADTLDTHDTAYFATADHTHQGGSDGEASVVLTGNPTTASTSFVDLAGLSFPVLANSTYIIEAFLIWRTSNTTYGIGFSFNGPANKTIACHMTTITLTASTVYLMNGSDYNLPNATSGSALATGTNYMAVMEAILQTGATPGNFQIRWRSENASGTMTAVAGSTLRYRKVA